jgi:N-acetylglucosaminyl-diphospho-decaprenol L-rhamnosyltransferase
MERAPMSLGATAILVTYNSAAVIGAALASLPAGMPAIVVDNASKDDSAAIAEKLGALVVRRSANAGFGVANNDGWRITSKLYVLFLNPDARLRDGALEALTAAAEAVPDADLLVPTLLKADGSVFRKQSSPICDPVFRSRGGLPEGIRDISFASGAVILARRSRLEALGGFDPDIFLYFEDDDLSRRVLDAGGRILHVEAALADHIGNVSSPSSPRLTGLKHWHMAWSERHVRRKFGLSAPGYWRVAESFVKMLWAQIRRDRMEEAKQLGLINGTLGHMRGLRAADVRDTLRMGRE